MTRTLRVYVHLRNRVKDRDESYKETRARKSLSDACHATVYEEKSGLINFNNFET